MGSSQESHDPPGELGNAELDSDDEEEEVIAGYGDLARELPIVVDGDRQQQSPGREPEPRQGAQPQAIQPNSPVLPRAEAASRSGWRSQRPVWHKDYHMK